MKLDLGSESNRSDQKMAKTKIVYKNAYIWHLEAKG